MNLYLFFDYQTQQREEKQFFVYFGWKWKAIKEEKNQVNWAFKFDFSDAAFDHGFLYQFPNWNYSKNFVTLKDKIMHTKNLISQIKFSNFTKHDAYMCYSTFVSFCWRNITPSNSKKCKGEW